MQVLIRWGLPRLSHDRTPHLHDWHVAEPAARGLCAHRSRGCTPQVHEMTEDEIDKLRTAVVIKTSSAMLRQHKFRTPEEQREQLQKTKAFAKALFYTIRGKASKRCGVRCRDGCAGVVRCRRLSGSHTSAAALCRPFITLQDVELFYPDTNEGKRQAESAFFLFAQDPKAKVNMNSVRL